MTTTWPQYPPDGLGGPQHYPVVIPALVFRDCREESCYHDGDCPTAEAIVCCRCHSGAPEIGDVAVAADWPCSFATEEAT